MYNLIVYAYMYGINNAYQKLKGYSDCTFIVEFLYCFCTACGSLAVPKSVHKVLCFCGLHTSSLCIYASITDKRYLSSFYVDSQNLNTGPHACAASPFPLCTLNRIYIYFNRNHSTIQLSWPPFVSYAHIIAQRVPWTETLCSVSTDGQSHL